MDMDTLQMTSDTATNPALWLCFALIAGYILAIIVLLLHSKKLIREKQNG